jgi:hypothetical protein
MLTAIVAAGIVVAVVLATPRRTRQRRRLSRLRPTSQPGDPPSAPPRSTRRSGRRAAFAAASALAGVVGVGGALGVVIGIVAAGGILLTGGEAPPPQAVPEDVAVVVDLIAGCLAAGLSMPAALDAAAVAGDPVTHQACVATAAALRHGVSGNEAWHGWQDDRWLAPVARSAARTTETGAAAADELQRAAARLRAGRRVQLHERVQRASVWVVVPLGLCFLPAFVLVGVVPVVAGLLTSLR